MTLSSPCIVDASSCAPVYSEKEQAAEAARHREQELEGQVNAANARADAANAAAALVNPSNAAPANDGPSAPILKPTGRFSLQHAMGLSGDRVQYLAIQVECLNPITRIMTYLLDSVPFMNLLSWPAWTGSSTTVNKTLSSLGTYFKP